MSDKIRITDAVLINGEVAKPGVYDRDKFTQSQLDWLTANRMVAEVLPDESNQPLHHRLTYRGPSNARNR